MYVQNIEAGFVLSYWDSFCQIHAKKRNFHVLETSSLAADKYSSLPTKTTRPTEIKIQWYDSFWWKVEIGRQSNSNFLVWICKLASYNQLASTLLALFSGENRAKNKRPERAGHPAKSDSYRGTLRFVSSVGKRIFVFSNYRQAGFEPTMME